MKLLLLLFLFLSTAAAQVQVPTVNCRIIRGHLYDLTAAEAEHRPDGLYSNYWISGEVESTYPKCLILRSISGYGYFLDHQRQSVSLRYSDSGGILQNLAAAKFADKYPHGVPVGALFAMEPEMRSLFTQQPIYRHTIVFNYITMSRRPI